VHLFQARAFSTSSVQQQLVKVSLCRLEPLKHPREINGNNLNNVRQTSRQFRNKNREYVKDKINELPANSKNKNSIWEEIN
jgi:hypothetical protein